MALGPLVLRKHEDNKKNMSGTVTVLAGPKDFKANHTKYMCFEKMSGLFDSTFIHSLLHDSVILKQYAWVLRAV